MLEFLIIYLACGAPCGVYFFFQNRSQIIPKKLWLKSFLTVFVWIPYVFKLLHDFATTKRRKSFSHSEQLFNEKINNTKKQLAQLLLDSNAIISIFEFREILERYSGLTMACNLNDKIPSDAEKEIFRIALRQNIQTGAKCLHRRNHLRLKFHQDLARKEFVQVISTLRFSVSESDKLRNAALEFVNTINDGEAHKALGEVFHKALQISENFAVPSLENEVWKSNEPRLSTSSKTPVHLQTLQATTATRND